MATAVLAVAGCGSSASRTPAAPSTRAALEHYLSQIEPLRLAVNRLLERADPILHAFRGHRISRAQAARRMGALELRFANFTVEVNSIEPRLRALRSLQAEYAHTYILEDAYLSALVSGLANDQLNALPDTQAAQRAAIIDWRTGLTVLAARAGVALPPDLQQAGRGEVAPAIGGG